MLGFQQDILYQIDPKRAFTHHIKKALRKPSKGIRRYLEKRHEVSIHPHEWNPKEAGFQRNYEEAVADLRAHESEQFGTFLDNGYFGESRVVRYYNESFFKGAIFNPSFIEAFTAKQYWEVEAQPGEVFARMETLTGVLYGSAGEWWFRTDKAPKSPMQAISDAAVLTEWNEFQILTIMTVPPGQKVKMYEGEIAPQFTQPTTRYQQFAGTGYMGGGAQLHLPRGGKVCLEPNFYEYYLFDKKDATGRLVKLKHTVEKGRTRLDLKHLEKEAPKVYDALVELSAKKGIPLW